MTPEERARELAEKIVNDFFLLQLDWEACVIRDILAFSQEQNRELVKRLDYCETVLKSQAMSEDTETGVLCFCDLGSSFDGHYPHCTYARAYFAKHSVKGERE